MKKRNPIAVFFLPFITFGFYALYWEVATKNEMNKLGADIPTAWLLIVPFVNYYWLWKYSVGVEKVTNGKMSAALAFVILFLLGTIGAAIIQSTFNSSAAGAAPMQPMNQSPAPSNPSPTVPQQPAAPTELTPPLGVAPTQNLNPQINTPVVPTEQLNPTPNQLQQPTVVQPNIIQPTSSSVSVQIQDQSSNQETPPPVAPIVQ